jgi:hypothetical protein
MSVVNECRKGDLIYNIIEGWARRNEADPNNIIDEERKIEIGEELEFIDAYLDENYKEKPYAWQVKFKCKDGYVSNAAQFGFVTEDEWNDLKKYFKGYYK